jgi:hypothetical protein
MKHLNFNYPFRSLLVVFFVYSTGCERSIVQPEALNETPAQALSSNLLVDVSYDETITTVIPGTGMATGAMTKSSGGGTETVLKDYSKTHRRMTIDTAGNVFVEVTYIEGDADIRIPIDLYNRIKNGMHPRHPKANPIKRYTIINNLYTAYGISGDVVYTKTFEPPQKPTVAFGGAEHRLTKRDKTGERMDNLFRGLEQKGIAYQLVGNRAVVYEETVQREGKTTKLKTMTDIKIGLPVRQARYNSEGQMEQVQVMQYANVNGQYTLGHLTTNRFGRTQSSDWGLKETTTESRANIRYLAR